MTTHPAHPDLAALVDPDVVVEVVASGFTLTEGPVWHPDGYLTFSEIPSSTRYRWTEAEGAVRVAHPTNRGNGMALAPDGTLVACEHETSMVVRLRLSADGSTIDRTAIASHYGDKELNAPNDVVVRSDGTVFFSDPTYGRMHEFVGKLRDPELDVRAVYSLAADGTLTQLVDDFDQPNGLCFSPDESVLYVNDSERYHIRRFEVGADGRLTGGEVLIDGLGIPGETSRGFCDGMKCDVEGNIWVTGPDGVWVVAPDGRHLGTVLVAEHTHNLAWGGPDFSQLFVTNSASLYRFQTRTQGAHRPGAV
jgi:gluconolactonase